MAIGGPAAGGSFSSATSSIIEGEKADRLLGLMDSVLRRNREDDSDDEGVHMIGGKDQLDQSDLPQTKDIFEYDPNVLVRNKNDLLFNIDEHSYLKLFLILTNPLEDEKIPLVCIKIIDGFIGKQLPKILDFFIFSSLKKVLTRTDWLRAADEVIEMEKIDVLKKRFSEKFPLSEGG